jgi:hypothetical protein
MRKRVSNISLWLLQLFEAQNIINLKGEVYIRVENKTLQVVAKIV